MKHVVTLLGTPGSGKTYTIAGEKGRGRRLGETHLLPDGSPNRDCLMGRVEWTEGEPLPALKDVDGESGIDADKCRVVELGSRLTVAYPWSYDGHRNGLGYVYHMNLLLDRYDIVVTDAVALLTWDQLRRDFIQEMRQRGAQLHGLILLTGAGTRLERQEARAERGGQQDRIAREGRLVSGWAKRNEMQIRPLQEAGVHLTELDEPFVEDLIRYIQGLPQ